MVELVELLTVLGYVCLPFDHGLSFLFRGVFFIRGCYWIYLQIGDLLLAVVVKADAGPVLSVGVKYPAVSEDLVFFGRASVDKEGVAVQRYHHVVLPRKWELLVDLRLHPHHLTRSVVEVNAADVV